LENKKAGINKILIVKEAERMNNKNKVTFITPVYVKDHNGLSFLESTIRGMKSQTDIDWQAIFIDDCSPIEETREVLLKHQLDDERIHVILLENRKSTGMCRNIGIQWAEKNSSSIVLFNDADDISHPDRVKIVRRIFRERPNAMVVYSGLTVIDENDHLVPNNKISEPIMEILESISNQPPQGPNCWYKLGLEAGYTNITSSTAVRTRLAIEEPFPDEFISEDCHTWYRYAAKGDFYYTDEIPTLYRIPSYVIRQSSNSYVDNFNFVKSRVDWDGFSKALDIAISKNVIESSSRLLIEAKFLLRLSESMGRDNDYELAYKIAMQAKETLSKYDMKETLDELICL
jgi:glycosyltransferase involved in cell wall biosynthesis